MQSDWLKLVSLLAPRGAVATSEVLLQRATSGTVGMTFAVENPWTELARKIDINVGVAFDAIFFRVLERRWIILSKGVFNLFSSQTHHFVQKVRDDLSIGDNSMRTPRTKVLINPFSRTPLAKLTLAAVAPTPAPTTVVGNRQTDCTHSTIIVKTLVHFDLRPLSIDVCEAQCFYVHNQCAH